MSFVKQLLDLQKMYLDKEGKNTFFKKTQKMECAKNISSQFHIEDLLSRSFYIIPNTNKIYIDYTIIKLFANPDNYDIIIEYIMSLYDLCINHVDSFELHINLKGFTISAAERYKTAIQDFTQKCNTSPMKYSQKTKCMRVYNSPSMMETISLLLKPFFDPIILEKITLYSKEQSQPLIDQLLL